MLGERWWQLKLKLKQVRYIIETLLLLPLLLIFRLLGLDRASDFGSFIARSFGPFMHLHRRARYNLRLIGLSKNERHEQQILTGMWNNLGRLMAESIYLGRLQLYDDKPLSHRGRCYKGRVRVQGRKNLEQLLSSKKGVIFFTAHTANWEFSALCITSLGFPLTAAYRPPNNPWIRRIIAYFRSPVSPHFAAKDAEGGRNLMKALKRGEAIGIISDQRIGQLILPFLGRKAQSLELPARLALRFDVPLVPVHVVRTKGSHFTLAIETPLSKDASLNKKEQIKDLTQKMNDRFSQWIKEHPEQWLWVHNRWRL